MEFSDDDMDQKRSMMHLAFMEGLAAFTGAATAVVNVVPAGALYADDEKTLLYSVDDAGTTPLVTLDGT
jgi:hypothetical protein